MNRFKITLGSALLGGLIASPAATAQGPANPNTTQDQPARTNPAPTTENPIVASEPIEFGLDDLVLTGELFNKVEGGATDSFVFTPLTGQQKNSPYLRTFTRTRQDPLAAKFGLKLSNADDALRSQLEIPAGQGVVVVEVTPGGLAEHAGLKVNDVLLSLGEHKAAEASQVRSTLLELGKGTLEIRLIREGKAQRMSFVGPEHGFPPESAEFWLGVPVSPIDPTLRAHLPSLSAEAGLVVNDVVKSSPADSAGVQKNDILVALGGKPLKTPDDLIHQIQAAGGKPTPLEIFRGGKPSALTVTPAKRVHPTTINVVSNPNYKYQIISPGLGVATIHDPYRLQLGALTSPVAPTQTPLNFEMNLRAHALADHSHTSIARIEAQLKEINVKLEGIVKALEALKKPEAK